MIIASINQPPSRTTPLASPGTFSQLLSVTQQQITECVPNSGSERGLTVELAITVEQLAALKADYQQVLELVGNKLPFALHEWHLAWCNHFVTSRRQVHIQPHIFVVRDEHRHCLAIVPFLLTRRAIGPIKISSLDLLGADPGLTEIRGPIIYPGLETQVAGLIQRELATLDSVDWVRWSSISAAFGDALASGSNLTFETPLLDYILDLPATWELLRAGLKRNIRESIRHSYNALKRDGIKFEFRVADTAAGIDAGLNRFFELHEMRANLKGTVEHPNVFGNVRLRDFFRDIFVRLGTSGEARLFQLVIDGEVVAARAAFVIKDSMYLYFSGFDPKWADYSVMTTTLVEAIKYALNCHLKTVNFSTGQDVSKTRWGVREVVLARATAVGQSHLSHLAWSGYKLFSKDRAKHALLGKLSLPGARNWS